MLVVVSFCVTIAHFGHGVQIGAAAVVITGQLVIRVSC
jgi:hypothetical protein